MDPLVNAFAQLLYLQWRFPSKFLDGFKESFTFDHFEKFCTSLRWKFWTKCFAASRRILQKDAKRNDIFQNSQISTKSVYCFLSFGRCVLLWHCGGGIVHAFWNAKERNCEGGEKREERKDVLIFLFSLLHIFLPSHFLSLTSFLLHIPPPMYNSTTVVPKKLRSVQKVKSSKQIGEYWFPCGEIR